MTPENKLACSVIQLAINDFMADGNRRDECYLFLTGQTEIAKFWFSAANILPLSGSIEDIRAKLASP